MFSLNNRRLYVFKSLQAEGRLQTVPARCAKTARLMLEREAVERLGSDDEAEGVNSDGEQGSQEKKAHASNKGDKVEGVNDDGEEQNGEKKAHTSKQGDDSSPSKKPSKPAKAVRNMDDWTDEEDIGKKKRGKGKRGR
ncbi:hypothetical protein NLG97_g6787 [Lecanicillium saksenae]|uniref:Uncharacterized protein n=1 Tax=Lecanicillium saksenae TaxID=468837 RepID=A0ACC1QQI1_9HYPO|nr:hypothetical protein NLG97_g6787 [Lecanicillium saksenae]